MGRFQRQSFADRTPHVRSASLSCKWFSRRFCLRLPKKFVDRAWLNGVLSEVDCVETRIVGEHLVVEIARDELEVEDFDGGAGQLAALAPLRANMLAGDLRMFYLLWLTAVEADVFAKDAPEPLPGVGPLDGALEAFADFFQIDADLVAAAAERNALVAGGELQSSDINAAIRAFTTRSAWACSLDFTMATPLSESSCAGACARASPSAQASSPQKPGRSGNCAPAPPRSPRPGNGPPQRRRWLNASGARKWRRRREEVAAAARKKRLAAVAARGELAWREVDNEIERRNASGYDRAKALLDDLRDVASSQGTTNEFERRVATVTRSKLTAFRIRRRTAWPSSH